MKSLTIVEGEYNADIISNLLLNEAEQVQAVIASSNICDEDKEHYKDRLEYVNQMYEKLNDMSATDKLAEMDMEYELDC